MSQQPARNMFSARASKAHASSSTRSVPRHDYMRSEYRDTGTRRADGNIPAAPSIVDSNLPRDRAAQVAPQAPQGEDVTLVASIAYRPPEGDVNLNFGNHSRYITAPFVAPKTSFVVPLATMALPNTDTRRRDLRNWRSMQVTSPYERRSAE